MFIGIVAISKNFAIGKDGKLPWHYSADLKFFKRTTTGHVVVMGWNTWKSIGKPLPNRVNVVLSRNGKFDGDTDAKLARSKSEVIELADDLGANFYVIGGSQTFDTFADKIQRWYVTEIPVEIEGADTFMPRDFLDGFTLRETIVLEDGLRVKVFER